MCFKVRHVKHFVSHQNKLCALDRARCGVYKPLCPEIQGVLDEEIRTVRGVLNVKNGCGVFVKNVGPFNEILWPATLYPVHAAN